MADVPTLSGNEITDAVRLANVQGDGLLPEQGSTGIWEATTNLVTNGGFETNTTGWSASWAAILSRVTSEAKFGTASLRIVTDGVTTNGEGAQNVADAIALTAGNTYTFSCWVKGPVNGRVSETITWRNGGAYNGDVNTGVVTLTGAWQRMILTATAPALTDSCQLLVQLPFADPGGVQAITFYVDGIQMEQQPIATPYVETDGATATRNAARAQAPSSVLDETQGWVAARMRMGWGDGNEPYSGGGNDPGLFLWREDASNLIKIYRNLSGNSWTMWRRSGGGTSTYDVASTISSEDYVTVIGKWTATGIWLSSNGGSFGVGNANTFVPSITTSLFDIGTDNGSLQVDSDFFWFAAGSGTLSDADAARIGSFNNDPKMTDFPGTPTWFWDSGPDGPQVNTLRIRSRRTSW